MQIETIQHGFIVVDSPRGNDESAQRDSWINPFASVSAALRSVRDGDTVLIYPGPYLEVPEEPVEIAVQPGGGAPLYLANRRGVTLRGVGRPLVWFTKHGNGLTIENSSHIRVEGIDFKGSGLLTEAKPYYFALLLLNGVNDSIQIRDCGFTESGDHGIAHLLGPRQTNNSVFENNRFYNGGHMKHPSLDRDGAAIAVGGSGNRIYGNRIERWLRGIELESGDFPGLNTATSQNIISHNKLLQCWWQHMIITPTHHNSALFDQILIESNILQGWGCDPRPAFDPDRGWGHEGIYFAGGINPLIRGNLISDMWDGIGIRLDADWGAIRDALVSENRIWNVGRTGIHLASYGTPEPSFDDETVLTAQITVNVEQGVAYLSVVGPAGQSVRLQRRPTCTDVWTDWQNFTFGEGPVEFTDSDNGDANHFFYRVVGAVSTSGRVKRCRVANNKVGPCAGRGIWINGDFNVIDSNGVHQCRDGQMWEGLFVESGRGNVIRQNRLLDCLPLTDLGTETRSEENDVLA